MSTSPSPNSSGWESKFHLVLPDVEHRRVLLLPDDAGGRLPSLSVDRHLWVGDSHEIIALLREQLGLAGNFTILRYLRMELNPTEQRVQAWLVLEPSGEWDELPRNGRWLSRDELAAAPLSDRESQRLLVDFLDGEATGQTVPLRAPWARPGWFSRAGRWMTDTLAGLGRSPTGAMQQYRNLGISSVLRVPTADGLVYLKATAKLPLFVNEGRLMEKLAVHFPRWIPAPIARHDGNSWMLLDDFGPNLWQRDKKDADFAQAAAEYARLQQASAPRVEELLALGCFDRRLPVLAEQIDALLAHPLTATHADADELSQLVALAPRLSERCAQLAAFGLPDTLVHGDLHLGNVAANGDGYLFFDWSDACVAHPFLDMITPYYLEKDEAKRARGKEAYLALWEGWGSRSALEEAWALAKPLAALHQAVSYLHILLGQEEVVHPEMASGLRDFVEFTLRAMDEI